MPRFIVLELSDHVTDADALEFANEINETFQPHHAARVVTCDALPAEPAPALALVRVASGDYETADGTVRVWRIPDVHPPAWNAERIDGRVLADGARTFADARAIATETLAVLARAEGADAAGTCRTCGRPCGDYSAPSACCIAGDSGESAADALPSENAETHETPADAPRAGEVWIDGYGRRQIVTRVVGAMVYTKRPDARRDSRTDYPSAPSDWHTWTREENTDPSNRRITRGGGAR